MREGETLEAKRQRFARKEAQLLRDSYRSRSASYQDSCIALAELAKEIQEMEMEAEPQVETYRLVVIRPVGRWRRYIVDLRKRRTR